MNRNRNSLSTLCVVVACLTLSTNCHANSVSNLWSKIKALKWEDGRTRVEAQGWTGTRSGRRSRADDVSAVITLERDFVLGKRTTVGARLIPLFYYDADADPDEDYPHTDIWGAGFGLTVRGYFKEAQNGMYFEFAESVVGLSDKFNGNSGSANFMTELGLGYELKSDWHVSGRWRHLSNSGFADHNSGINAFGIGIGKSL